MKHAVLGLALLAGCSASRQATNPGPVPVPAPTRAAYDATIIDKDITFWQDRVKADPTGSIGWVKYANALNRRAAESDSMEAAVKAEAAARKSLTLRPRGNGAAAGALTTALLSQHRFGEVLKVAPDHRSRFDILLELGRYAEAREVIAKHALDWQDPSGLALQARWAELNGDRAKAEAMLQKAVEKVRLNGGLNRETVAWFLVRLGQNQLYGGQITKAKATLTEALETYPRSYRAMIALQRVAETESDWRAMADWGHRAEAIVTMPESLAMIGRAYANLGDKKQADEHYGEAIAAAGGHESTHHHHSGTKPHGHPQDRQLAQILADLGRDPQRAVKAAKADVTQRSDIWAYDTLAWAEYRAGNMSAARAAMQRALALGTDDTRLKAHAQLILGEQP